MNQELKKKWVAALRSNDYKQGTGYLKAKNTQGETQYCCLGVLCEITGIEFGTLQGSSTWMPGLMEAYPIKGTEALGMPEDNVLVSWGFENIALPSSLAQMNDDGDTFIEIAEYIELNL